MAQLIIDIDDSEVSEAGLEALKNDFIKMMEFRRLSKIARKIENSVTELGLDHDQIWKESKKKAFAKFKEQHLKSIIP
ncbi:MAG: hypothetical protein RLZZ306_936 [Bacteroidota bacterium]